MQSQAHTLIHFFSIRSSSHTTPLHRTLPHLTPSYLTPSYLTLTYLTPPYLTLTYLRSGKNTIGYEDMVAYAEETGETRATTSLQAYWCLLYLLVLLVGFLVLCSLFVCIFRLVFVRVRLCVLTLACEEVSVCVLETSPTPHHVVSCPIHVSKSSSI